MESQLVNNPLPLPVAASQLIPTLLHFVWVGDKPLEALNREWIASWVHNNPGYRAILWATHPTNHLGIIDGLEVRTLPPLVNQWAFDNIGKWVTGRATIAAQSDIARMDIVARYGGVYLDTDVESLQPLGEILRGVRLFYADEFGGVEGNYMFGAVANHPAVWSAVRELTPHLLSNTTSSKASKDKRKPLEQGALDATGPRYLARRLRVHPDCVIYPAILFNPLWARGDANSIEWPAVSIANHHYQGTWYDQKKRAVDDSRSQGFIIDVE